MVQKASNDFSDSSETVQCCHVTSDYIIGNVTINRYLFLCNDVLLIAQVSNNLTPSPSAFYSMTSSPGDQQVKTHFQTEGASAAGSCLAH